MLDNSLLVSRAERLTELAAEAETKKEADKYWREYRQIMMQVTGDKTMFRRKRSLTNKPSRVFVRTLVRCPCSSEFKAIRWSKKRFEYEMACGHNVNYSYTSTLQKIDGVCYEKRICSCGKESPEQIAGNVVMFSCPLCKKESGWHGSNALARDAWNMIHSGKELQ